MFLPVCLTGFEVKSVLLLLRRASAVPVRFESIREEISEYHVISVVPIKPNFVVLTCKLIVTEPMADATTLRIRGKSRETVLVRSPRRPLTGLHFRKRLRWILIDVKLVTRFAR